MATQQNCVTVHRQLNVSRYIGVMISLMMFRRSLRFFYYCCICSQIKTRHLKIYILHNSRLCNAMKPHLLFVDLVRFDLSAALYF